MNTSTFGFAALETRYRYLKNEDPPYLPPESRLYDLDGLITWRFGEGYVNHPKLANLAALNSLNMRAFLQGKDEAAKYAAGDHGAVRDSTSEKSRIIANLLDRFISGRLLTKNSAGSVLWAGQRLDAVATVLELGNRMLYVQREIRKRHQKRSTMVFEDEYDDQDLLRSMLRIFFDDVRSEEWVPSYAGAASRIDFVLPRFSLAVELKRTREGLPAAKVGEQLLADRDRYKEHHGVSHLICLVFDYEGLLANPRGLEADLSRASSTEALATTVRIFDR